MKGNGIAATLLAATPLAAIVLYFALTGQQQVRTDQERHEVKQEIQAEKFDLEFDQMNRDITGDPMPAEEVAKRQEKITDLEQKAEHWNDRFEKEFKQMDEDMADLKTAIEEGKQ